MEQYIKDTYLLFCGQGNRQIKEFLYLKYSEKRTNLPAIHFHLKGHLSLRLARINRVINKVFDLYNVYEPVKKEQNTDIDFTSEEIDSIIKKQDK